MKIICKTSSRLAHLNMWLYLEDSKLEADNGFLFSLITYSRNIWLQPEIVCTVLSIICTILV